MQTPEQVAHQVAGDWIMGPIDMGDLERKIADTIHADRSTLLADNATLRTALAQTVDALTAYFNKRGVDHAMRKGNEDIGDLADALSNSGPVSTADHPGAPLLALLAAARAYRDAWQGTSLPMGPLAIGEYWERLEKAIKAVDRAASDAAKE